MGGGASLMVPMKFSVVTEKTVSTIPVSLFLTVTAMISSPVTPALFVVHFMNALIGFFHSRSKHWLSY